MTTLKDQVDRLSVQLAGCAVAAQGYTDPKFVAKPGDYGWSASYDDTLRLRLRFNRLYEALSSYPDDDLPFDLRTALKEVRADMSSVHVTPADTFTTK